MVIMNFSNEPSITNIESQRIVAEANVLFWDNVVKGLGEMLKVWNENWAKYWVKHPPRY